MKNKLNLDKIKQVTLGIMKEFKRVATLLELPYCLAYGTLLGAVRHQGFIPWDDDADVWMKRVDYDILIQKFNDYCQPHYRLYSCEIDSSWKFTFAKVIDLRTEAKEYRMTKYPGMGIFLDVFPLDYVPEDFKSVDEQNQKIWWFWKRHFLQKIETFAPISYPWLSWQYVTLTRPKTLKGSCNKTCREYNDYCRQIISGKELRLAACAPDARLQFDADIFDELQEMPFEDEVFSIPKSWDRVLRKSFGDYMQLPPVSKRKTNHYKYALWRDSE